MKGKSKNSRKEGQRQRDKEDREIDTETALSAVKISIAIYSQHHAGAEFESSPFDLFFFLTLLLSNRHDNSVTLSYSRSFLLSSFLVTPTYFKNVHVISLPFCLSRFFSFSDCFPRCCSPSASLFVHQRIALCLAA